MEITLFWLCIAITLAGCLALASAWYFGLHIFRDSFTINRVRIEYLIEQLARISQDSQRVNVVQEIAGSIANYRERRNEFWTNYSQLVLAMFIVTLLTILLLTKTIEPDAGLPILSGVASYAIAKTVNTNSPQNSNSSLTDGEPQIIDNDRE